MKSIYKILTLFCLFSCQSLTKNNSDLNFLVDANREPAQAIPLSQRFNHHTNLGEINWRNLFTELFVLNNSKMVNNETDLKSNLYQSLYYPKTGAQNTYLDIVYKQPNTSDHAFRTTEKLMAWTDSLQAEFDPRLKMTTELAKIKNNEATEDIVSTLMNAAKDPKQKLVGSKNYFKTAVGQMIMENLKDYVLVVVPGFGSHTIKDYTWPEILRHINDYYHRTPQRVVKEKKMTENLGAEWIQFYSATEEVKFDIIHPMGYELGFSMGSDHDSADELANRLLEIKEIPAYANKKFILLGYSKGTPIATKMVAERPEVAKDVVAIITMAGVVQGSIPASQAMRKLTEAAGVDTPEQAYTEFVKQYEQKEKLLTQIDLSWLKSYVNHGMSDTNQKKISDLSANVDPTNFQNYLKAFKNDDQRKKIFEGIYDLSHFQSLKWNLTHFNDDHFKKPITFFNLSMVANIKDMVLPQLKKMDDDLLTPPTIVPQVSSSLDVDYSGYSRDNVFLYLTSVGSFEQAPGGLFDAQVAWLDTKSMLLDIRPLAHSLTQKEMKIMKEVLSKEFNKNIPDNIFNFTRRSISEAVLGKTVNNINIVDLGDLRGTHWDPAFEQVYKPDASITHYKHRFPRRALQTSVLEMLAMYKQLGGFSE